MSIMNILFWSLLALVALVSYMLTRAHQKKMNSLYDEYVELSKTLREVPSVEVDWGKYDE